MVVVMVVEMVEVTVMLQYPYFEDEEKKELHLLYDIQNRIANQMKQIKTVTTINYIKHFGFMGRQNVSFAQSRMTLS